MLGPKSIEITHIGMFGILGPRANLEIKGLGGEVKQQMDTLGSGSAQLG